MSIKASIKGDLLDMYFKANGHTYNVYHYDYDSDSYDVVDVNDTSVKYHYKSQDLRDNIFLIAKIEGVSITDIAYFV